MAPSDAATAGMNYNPIGPVQPWLNRLLEFAISILAVALLLNWAWQLIRPLVSVIVAIASLVGIVTFMVRRHRSW